MNTKFQNEIQVMQDSEPRHTASPSGKTKIFIHGLHPFTTNEDILNAFRPYCQIEDLEFTKNPHTGKHRGFAFFTVPSKKIAEAVLKADHVICGRVVHCDLKNSDKEQQLKKQMKRVFIGGVPSTISDSKLKEHFTSKFGPVKAAYTIKDINGKRKSYGYIDFSDQLSAEEAVKASPIFIDGLKIDVRPYKRRENQLNNSNNKKRNNRRGGRRSNNSNSNNSVISHQRSSSISTELPLDSLEELDLSKTHYSAPQYLIKLKKDMENKIDVPSFALPDFGNKVLGCFMNQKGEELIKLTHAYMAANARQDILTANFCFGKISHVKNQIFGGNYMSEIGPLHVNLC